MRIYRAIMPLLAAAVLPAAAQARCDLSLNAPGQVRFEGESGNGYDSFAASRGDSDFAIAIANNGNEPCNALISVQRIDAVDGLRGPTGDQLTYLVTLPGGLATIVDPQTDVGRPINAVAATIPQASSIARDLTLRIPIHQLVPSGMYQSTVLVRLIDAADLSIITERSVELAARVRAAMTVLLFDGGVSANLNSAGGSSDRRIDFGTLREGEREQLAVLVQSNDQYSVSLSSSHNGQLWHTVRGASQAVPYSVSFGGRRLDLASGRADVGSSPPTGVGGTSNPLVFTIGPVGVARAGRYEDDLTITVLPAG